MGGFAGPDVLPILPGSRLRHSHRENVTVKSVHQLIDNDTGVVAVEDLELAKGYWSRVKGLQFRKSLPLGRGLLLIPGGSIHTFWMRFAIDVVMLDRDLTVLDVRREVRPWRIVKAVPGTHAILELPAGTAAVSCGATLRLVQVERGDKSGE